MPKSMSDNLVSVGVRPGRTPLRSPSQVDDSTMMVGEYGKICERDGVSLGHPTSLMTRGSTTAGDVHHENRWEAHHEPRLPASCSTVRMSQSNSYISCFFV